MRLEVRVLESRTRRGQRRLYCKDMSEKVKKIEFPECDWTLDQIPKFCVCTCPSDMNCKGDCVFKSYFILYFSFFEEEMIAGCKIIQKFQIITCYVRHTYVTQMILIIHSDELKGVFLIVISYRDHKTEAFFVPRGVARGTKRAEVSWSSVRTLLYPPRDRFSQRCEKY